MFRPTGREWDVAELEPANMDVSALTTWQGGFAVVGMAKVGGGERPVAWLSEDGSDWQLVADAFGRRPSRRTAVVDVVGYRGGLLAIGRHGNRVVVWMSDDGRSWTRTRHDRTLGPAGVPAAPHSLDLRGVATHGGRIVISGQYHGPGADPEGYERVWTSSNGKDWQSGPPKGLRVARLIQGLTADRRGFVGLVNVRGCGMGDVMQVVRSKDGRSWRMLSASRLPCFNVLDLAYDATADAHYAVGYRGDYPVVVRAEHLRDWQRVYVGSDHVGDARVDWSAYAVTADDGFVMVAGDGYDPVDNAFDFLWVLTSTDGEDWELSTGWPDMLETEGVQGAAIADGQLVVLVDWRTSRAFVTEAAVPEPPG